MFHIRLTKLSTLPDAAIDPNGARTGGPIQDGYTVKGHIEEMPQVGKQLYVERYESNGVKMAGTFTTSTVQEVGDGSFKTLNSTYEIEVIGS